MTIILAPGVSEHTRQTLTRVQSGSENLSPMPGPAAVRRFIKRVGIDYINPLFELRIADAAATGNGNVDLTVIETLSEKINAEKISVQQELAQSRFPGLF